MVTVGGYLRISDDDDGDSAGVGRQRDDIRALADVRGWDVVWYEDNDLSAYKRNVRRPRFEQMLKDLKAGVLDGIAAWDIDRLCRQPKDLERLIDIYEESKRKLRFVTQNQSYDLTAADGRFMARLFVSIANKASADTSRRIKRKQLELAHQGKIIGGPAPFGWDPDDPYKLWPKEAIPLRRAIDDSFRGKRDSTIAREWEAAGVVSRVTDKPFSHTNLGRLLTRARNAGIVVYQGKPLRDEKGDYVMGAWEPIMTIEEWEALVEMREQRKQGINRDRSSKYLLSGIVRCGICGHKMRGQKRNRGKSYGYICVANAPGKCGRVSIAGEQTDDMIRQLVWADAKRSARNVKELPKEWPDQWKLDEVEKDIASLRERWKNGEISDDTFIFMVKTKEEEKDKLRHERAVFNAQFHGQKTLELSDIEQRWAELSLEQQRAVINHSLAAVIIEPSAKGKRYNPNRVRPIFR